MSDEEADRLIEALNRKGGRLDQMLQTLDGFSREVRTRHLELHGFRNEIEWGRAAARTKRRAAA